MLTINLGHIAWDMTCMLVQKKRDKQASSSLRGVTEARLCMLLLNMKL